MENKKKIIWFLIIGAIIIGDYFLSNYQNKKTVASIPINSIVPAIQKDQEISVNSQQSEIDNLKNEVENLKNQKPQTVIKEVPATAPKEDTGLDISTIVSQWRPSIAHIECKWYGSDGTLLINAFGSGLLVRTLNNIYLVFTNRHVLTDQWGSVPWTCTIKFPNSAETYTINVDTATQTMKDIAIDQNLDIGEIFIRNPGPYVLSNAKVVNFCKNRALVGEQLVVLGYPGIGSPTDITATEGIISGYDNGYYVTSAKVEHGNSGGAAISIKNNCYLGIPSFVSSGELESLARILDYSYLNALWGGN
ncbi:MAG: serine protease [Candidatus Gribaldobacteria bacterium]|nr:serine protease [Candidatus Gribaldobacteria bacterium]